MPSKSHTMIALRAQLREAQEARDRLKWKVENWEPWLAALGRFMFEHKVIRFPDDVLTWKAERDAAVERAEAAERGRRGVEAELRKARAEAKRLRKAGDFYCKVEMDGDDVLVTVNGEERMRFTGEWAAQNAAYNEVLRLRGELEVQRSLAEIRLHRGLLLWGLVKPEPNVVFMVTLAPEAQEQSGQEGD